AASSGSRDGMEARDRCRRPVAGRYRKPAFQPELTIQQFVAFPSVGALNPLSALIASEDLALVACFDALSSREAGIGFARNRSSFVYQLLCLPNSVTRL